MNKLILAFCFITLTSTAAVLPRVDTIAALRARGNNVTNEQVIVSGYYTPGDWGEDRIARFVSNASTVATNTGCEFASTINSNNHWRFPDCDGPFVDARWFGIMGAQIDPENLLNEQDSNFSDLTRDASWTGYGDGNRIITDPTGTGVTYGVFSVPTSPSVLGSNATMVVYSREPGISTIPPGGILSLRLIRRGHGYTNATETITTVSADGTNYPPAFSIQIGQGFRDAFFDSGGFKVVTHPSATANQYMKLSYYGTTNSPMGGLRAPLVTGKRYYFSLTAQRISGVSRTLYVGTSDSAQGTFTPTTNSATYTGSFVADNTELRIGLSGSTSASEVFLLDNISVTEGTAVADPADEGSRIAEALATVRSGKLLFPPARKFVSSIGFVLRNGQKIDGAGSTLKINVGTARSDGIQIFGEGSELSNLRIDYTADTPTDNEGEGSQSIIGLGHFQYTDYPQAGNVKLSNLKLYGGGKISQGPNALLIGGAYNVTVDTLYINGHTNLFNAIGIYWSGYNVQSVGTVHAKNIILQNINIGAMQNPVGNGANAITISAATGVSVQNLEALSVSGNFIRVIAGDIGFQQAKAEYGGLVQAGIMFDNVRCASVGRYGVRLQNIMPFQVDEPTPFIATNVPVTFDLTTDLVSWPGMTNKAADGALVQFSGTLPTGLITTTNYWVTWSSPKGFKVRAAIDGSGNGDVIDLSGTYSNVTASVWNAHMNTVGPLEIRGLQMIGTGPSFDGILADGCDGLLIHGQSSISGFRNGAWIETYTPNYNVIFRDTAFFENHNNGVYIPSGYNVIVEDCKIYGNGLSGTGDTAVGIRVTGGSGHKLINNQLGRQSGEITQGAGIKLDNNKPTLEWVVMEDNKVFGATAPSAFVLNTVAPTNLWTFSRVIGNTFVPSATLTNAWQSTASSYPFPVLTASALEAQKFTIAYNQAASFWVQRLELGANANVTGQPGDFNRTANTEKNGILQVPSYYTGVGTSAVPVQMARMIDNGTSSRFTIGAGESGGQNRAATVVDIRTAVSTAEGASLTVGLEVDNSGRSAIGPGSSGQQDSASALVIAGGLPLRLPRLVTNSIALRSGHMLYDTNKSRVYWSDGTFVYPIHSPTDLDTNTWVKIITSLQRGNGLSFTTNAGSNTLTISGNYVPGTNMVSVTNADFSVTLSTIASAVSVDGTRLPAANFADSTEFDVTATSTNVTYALKTNSVTWNKLSDASTNVWQKIIATLQRGNGVHFATNAGANTLTISGNYLPGANMTAVTNADGSITLSSSGGGGGGPTNGSAVYVEGSFVSSINLVDSTEIDGSVSGTNFSASIVANSIATNKVNSTFRSFFKDRSTDTGTQTASTISDFADVQWANFTNSLVSSNNISLAYDTANKKVMISSTGSGGSATNAPVIAVDGTVTTNVNFADSAELLVTKTDTNVTYALATSGVTAGTYSNATITVDSKGRITVASTGSGGGSSTNTVSSIWKTIAGVRFSVTNAGASAVVMDDSLTSYSGVGTNITIVGSNNPDDPILFRLSFSTPLTHTNYLVFADFQNPTATAAGVMFVNSADGRRTNQVEFYVRDTTGDFFQLGAEFIRVWVVDPSVVISGSELTEIPAHLLTGTIDDLRIPSTILRTNDAAATYATIDNPTFTGTATFADAVIPTLTVTNLIVPYQAYGSDWLTSTNVATQRAVAEKIVSMENQYGMVPFVSGITGGQPMIIDDLFNLQTASTVGDAGTSGANNGGSFQYTSATNGAGRQGIRVMRVQNTNCAPVFGWYDNRTFAFPTQGSTNQLFFGADIKTPDKTSGASLVNIYSLQVGFNSLATGDTNRPATFMGFIHQTNLIGSVNWAFGAVSNSVGVTWVDTGVAYTPNTWYSLGSYIDGTNAIGYVNGVPVVTNSANLPFGLSAGASVRNAVISGTTTLDTTLNALAIQYK